ncbi:DUF6531 domain-containing protein [Streptomyces althioticus]
MAAAVRGGDPIDMVSGEMLMEQVDLELGGLLPLIARRTHVSTYRRGRYFGRSWASTLDQRLATRNDFSNDPDNMEPMTRSENSRGGALMDATYRQDVHPTLYSCS